MRLLGHVAIVTGGSRGIGKGISLCLAKAGADIAINYRKADDAARQAAAEIEALGRKASLFKGDVSDYAAAQDMVGKVVETFGKVNILVCNAGVPGTGRSVMDTPPEEIRQLHEVHVMGAYNFAKAALPYMRQQRKGNIIFVSSALALTADPTNASYVMAKRAIEGLSEVLSAEEATYGIRVNAVAPGLVETDMARKWFRYRRGGEMEEFHRVTPFGHLCRPEDVGNVCVFLASDEASYVTGAVILIHGATIRKLLFPP